MITQKFPTTTPMEIAKRGFLLFDTNSAGVTGIALPVNMTEVPLIGELHIAIQNMKDIPFVRAFLEEQTQAGPKASYRITVRTYEPNSDSLLYMPGIYDLSVIPNAFREFDEKDMVVIWKQGKR